MKVLKLLIGIGLLYALIHFGILDLKSFALLGDHPGLLALAVGLSFGTILVGAARWNMLLHSQGVVMRLGKAFQIVLMGAFFNTFLPGAFGGDIVRGIYVFRAAGTRQTMAVFSLFMDRLSGIAALLSLGVAVAALRPLHVGGGTTLALYVLTAAFVTGMVGLLLFGHRVARFLLAHFPRRAARVAPLVEDLSNGLELYLRHWKLVLGSYILSLLLWGLAVGSLLVVCAILRIGSLTVEQYAMAGVWSLLFNSIPITPGGLGVGEGAFAQVCVLMEAVHSGAPYATVFLAYRAATILATIPGVFVYWTYRHEIVASQAAADMAPQEPSSPL